MVNRIKFLREKKLKSGKTVFIVNPPDYVKERIGASYETYDSKADAAARCIEVDRLHQAWRKDVEKVYRINSSTVLGMINYYKTTDSWAKLAPNSKATYNHLITGLNKVHLRINNGPFTDMLASNVRKDHVQKLYAYLRDNVSAHRARHTIKFLKLVWNVCEDNDKLKGNPWKVIKLDSDTICDILWTERQVDRFIETADTMGFPSIGTLAMLCYDLCQRPGDMRQLKWENFDGETFVFTQEKTKTEIIVDASPRILKRLVADHNMYGQDDFILNYEKTGTGYDNRMYNKIAALVRKECMLPERLKIRFLRHSGATDLAESGATEDEIAAVTGHKSRQMLNIYVKRTKKLAATAQSKRFKENEQYY
jgi:integrase